MSLQPRQANVIGGPADGIYRSRARRQRDGDQEYIQPNGDIAGDTYHWSASINRWIHWPNWARHVEGRCQSAKNTGH